MTVKPYGAKRKKPTCLTLDPDVLDGIERMARAEGISRSQYANRLLTAGLKARKQEAKAPAQLR